MSSCILRAVPVFPLGFVKPQKKIVKAGAQKLGQGKTKEETKDVLCTGFHNSFPWLDELKRKNYRNCL